MEKLLKESRADNLEPMIKLPRKMLSHGKEAPPDRQRLGSELVRSGEDMIHVMLHLEMPPHGLDPTTRTEDKVLVPETQLLGNKQVLPILQPVAMEVILHLAIPVAILLSRLWVLHLD